MVLRQAKLENNCMVTVLWFTVVSITISIIHEARYTNSNKSQFCDNIFGFNHPSYW